MIEKRDVWFIIGFLLVVIGLLMMISIAKASPTYSNAGQNATYIGMGDYIELRAKWTPGSIPYDISTGVYNDYLSVSSQDGAPTGIAFNNDGSKLYVVGIEYHNVYEYYLTTPYDISTGTYNDYLSVSSQDGHTRGIAFNNDGSKLYVVGEDYDKVYEYNLSTPYDISTGTYNDYLSVSSQDSSPQGIAFNNDGSKLYVVGSANDKVYEYNLSTAYDISTGVYNDYLSVSSQDGTPTGIAFNNDGTKLYVVGSANDKVYEYNLSTAYDVSTGVYNDYLSIGAQDDNPEGIAFNNDGSKLYVVGRGNDKVYEYILRYKLDTAILYVNITGSYQAVDTIDLNDSATAKWTNFSYSNNTCNKAVKWKITANDSSGNSNTTTIGTFYLMPYIYSGTGLDITTCTSKHNATITPTSTGDINATFLSSFFVRNATFKECNYKITEGADRIKITNASEYCNITVINLDAESGTSFYLEEDTGTSGYPPSNLPSAIAAAGLVIIVIYTITTRKRS